MKTASKAAIAVLVAGTLTSLCAHRAAHAYVEISYSLGRVINESTNVMLLRVESVDKEKNIVIYRKVSDIKGKHPTEVVKHNIGRGGFHPREWQNIMAWAEPGKTAVFMHNGGASETCIDNYWYQAYAGGEWWSMSHAEPYLLRSFAGKPEKLAAAVGSMLGGAEVVVPCMVDGDKNALQLRTARIQRLKASLKIADYNAQRDFVGWGGDDFRALGGMPGFSHYAGVSRIDPGAGGVSVQDIDGDGQVEFLFYGRQKVTLQRVAGTSLEEVTLPYAGGARSADWADYNGDGKPDLLLATASGPKLLTNQGKGVFKDDSGRLPPEAYYNLSAAAWIDYDNDKRPDMLLANGYLGLRMYHNLGPAAAAKPVKPAVGPWYFAGPFDNAGGRGFDTAYPPEAGVDLKAQYTGKAGAAVKWQEGKFTDGQVNSLLPLFPGNLQSENAIYLYRQLDFGGAVEIPLSLGSDDTLTVWLKGQKLLAENTARACAPDQNRVTLKLKPGRNELLIKVCNGTGDFAFYANMTGVPKTAEPLLFQDISGLAGLGPAGLAGQLKGDHLAVADLNGDGFQDFVYNAGQGVVAMRSGKGFVDYKEAGVAFKPGGVTPLLTDINGDGKADLVVPQETGSKLYLNDGKARFSDASAKSGDLAKPLGRVTSAATADFDGDGKPDIFLGCFKNGNHYLRNNGDGTFTDTSERLGFHHRIFNSRGLALADVNKDGVPDLLLANEGQESAVLLGAPKKTGGDGLSSR
jgi:hypothetical protein